MEPFIKGGDGGIMRRMEKGSQASSGGRVGGRVMGVSDCTGAIDSLLWLSGPS